MKLYYTTAKGPETPQESPAISLGGFISSTSPKNDDFENLFPNLSQLAIKENRKTYIALMLRNELGATATNVRVHFEYPIDSYSKYTVAGVIPAIDVNGAYKMERVSDKGIRPFVADFEEATELAPYVVGNIADEEVVGFWFCRELLKDFIKEDQSDVYEPDPLSERRYIPKVKNKEDVIAIKIVWD